MSNQTRFARFFDHVDEGIARDSCGPQLLKPLQDCERARISERPTQKGRQGRSCHVPPNKGFIMTSFIGTARLVRPLSVERESYLPEVPKAPVGATAP
jgi:hypothetical protein